MDNMLNNRFVKVEMFGKEDTIHNHLLRSKRILEDEETVIRIANLIDEEYFDEFDFFEINNRYLPKEYFSSFEKMLWCKYLRQNANSDLSLIPEDKKAHINFNTTDDGKEFSELLKCKEPILVLNKDIFLSKQDIICHQVNCQGVMGKGIAKTIKEKFPECFEEYKRICDSYPNKNDLLGSAVMVESNGKIIANLFGQLTYGSNGTYTDYNAFEKALFDMKEYAMLSNLSVAIPYGIGSSLAGGDWNKVYAIIQKVFVNYPVILYKI